MRGESMLSASDVALLSGNNGRSGDGFGDNGAWWIVVFLIFALGGFGGRGFGSNGGGSMGATDNYVLASDFAQLSRQLDNGFDRVANGVTTVNQGLCDGFYAMNTGMLNGFAGIQSTLCTGFGGINNAITTSGYETRSAISGLSSDLAQCCCNLRSDIQGVNYNMAMNTNAIQQTLCGSTRDIIENQNANYRALHDEIVANRIEDKNAQIQAQQNEINALRLSASQATQNEYLLNQLRTGCPVNAQLVCGNTPIPVQYIGAGCGCNSGCGNY